ncbi:hypothetical protein LshimejAT787_0505350 [Lyophyllum shimeji]|uniref:Uncharacterized protein n=1 Tax=Lyophyllum shimeji TaxID=47721 RepID=A0A9P3PLR6_LYOSH|nr:hypothetical protein LshimejAT787_0505350 [Lyophyllum shimeji]
MSAWSEHPVAVPAVAKAAPVTAQPKAESMKMEPLPPQHDPESCSQNDDKPWWLPGPDAGKTAARRNAAIVDVSEISSVRLFNALFAGDAAIVSEISFAALAYSTRELQTLT